jgi:hypothetical protein
LRRKYFPITTFRPLIAHTRLTFFFIFSFFFSIRRRARSRGDAFIPRNITSRTPYFAPRWTHPWSRSWRTRPRNPEPPWRRSLVLRSPPCVSGRAPRMSWRTSLRSARVSAKGGSPRRAPRPSRVEPRCSPCSPPPSSRRCYLRCAWRALHGTIRVLVSPRCKTSSRGGPNAGRPTRKTRPRFGKGSGLFATPRRALLRNRRRPRRRRRGCARVRRLPRVVGRASP